MKKQSFPLALLLTAGVMLAFIMGSSAQGLARGMRPIEAIENRPANPPTIGGRAGIACRIYKRFACASSVGSRNVLMWCVRNERNPFTGAIQRVGGTVWGSENC